MTANFTPRSGSAASAIPPISRAATRAAVGFTTSLAVGGGTICNSGSATTPATKTAQSTQRNGRKTSSRRKTGLAPTVTGGCPKGRFESQLRSMHALMFEAEPMTHPHVMDAYHKAAGLLKRHRIPFRVIGGLAVNLHGAGRPTKDVDLVISRRNWHRARDLLQRLATDFQGIRLGLPDEPEKGLGLVGPHGVCRELWPAGGEHAQNGALT